MSTTTFEIADWRTDFVATGQGSPVVYLHGFDVPTDSADFVARLAEEHTVYIPKLPGFSGASEANDSIRSIHDLALNVREFIESLGQGPVDLVGHSVGGMIAAEVAAVSPGIVRRLVLVDSYGLWDDNEPLPDPFVRSGEAFRAAIGDPNLSGKGDRLAETLWRATDVGSSTKYLWPVPDRGLIRRIRFIKCPVLVLHGEHDVLIPVSYARQLAEELPDARLEVLAGGSHSPMLDRPEDFVASVRGFLS